MKSFIQLLLLLALVSISYFFYKKYFSAKNIDEKQIILSENKTIIKENNKLKENNNLKEKNNLIKKLKYKVKLSKSGEYEINAKSSEISYLNDAEIVSMTDVVAIFLDDENRKITVTSNQAKFNTLTYDTKFSGNIEIIYFNNVINSQKIRFYLFV